jgi:P pilus assembly chaperone PapD
MSTTTETLALPRNRLLRCARIIFGSLIGLLPLHAAADLMLHPTRIVFDKNQRAAQVELVNNGSDTVTYRISVVNRRMNETGEFSEANPPLPGEQFADAMLRHSPRQVVLAPGAAQTVRIQLRKPAELASGEYRSHLLFTQIADTVPAPSAGTSDGLEIKLSALLGTSIPVIVRHGQTAATATLANLSIERAQADQAPVLAFDIQREGNRSVYGDLVVTLMSNGGAEQPLARANGVAVYVPNPLRRVRIALPPAAAQASGMLRVVFQERADEGGKPLAEARLPLR